MIVYFVVHGRGTVEAWELLYISMRFEIAATVLPYVRVGVDCLTEYRKQRLFDFPSLREINHLA